MIGSRICHDLINPLGAIGNGLELLGLSGANVPSEEMTLVSQSVENASAKVKFFRLAFGDASPDQTVAAGAMQSLLDQVTDGTRLRYDWGLGCAAPRPDVRTALLAALCVETALPMGGTISVRCVDNVWTVSSQHERLTLDPDLWVPLNRGEVAADIKPAQVHFALLPDLAAVAGRSLTLTHGADWVKISF